MTQVVTGFHAIEERVRRAAGSADAARGLEIFYARVGPRVKKILAAAAAAGISAQTAEGAALDAMVRGLPEPARDHRGIVLVLTADGTGAASAAGAPSVDLDSWAAEQKLFPDRRATVLLLDSVTDPHNVGAIIRSADQFGADLVVLPARRSAGGADHADVIARASAGASAYVPVATVTNLTRAAQKLKDAGFWLYGADAGGESVQALRFADKTALVLGSEGSGIGRNLREQCDAIVSIPTCGRIDSLNVSVAAGVLLYERHRQGLAGES